jgi:NNP family nitrate/nitrite transporter-like MFS transporter
MPAIFDSLVYSRGLTAHVAWRITFIVPSIIIIVTAIAMLLLCPDTPQGKWSERHLHAQQNLAAHGISGTVVDIPTGNFADKKPSVSGTDSPVPSDTKIDFEAKQPARPLDDHEANLPAQDMLDTARGEIVAKPSFKEAMPVIFSLQTLVLAGCYFCSFGSELAINSILGAYYATNFPKLGQTGTGNWAAMFGLLNVVLRPLGGILSDLIYGRTKSLWAKKFLVHGFALGMGIFLIAIGATNPHDQHTMFGLVAGLAIFLEAGNGANFALVPHVHPFANGIVSGVTGAAGNLGGIVFAIIFRVEVKNYAKAFYIIGAICIGVNVALSWIRPIPRGQIGGH